MFKYAEVHKQLLGDWTPNDEVYPPVVVSAANLFRKDHEWYTVPSSRHYNPLMVLLCEQLNLIPPCDYEVEQGFIDQHGRFLTRLEALHIAKERGQYQTRRNDGHSSDKRLFSEDLY